MRLDNLLYRYRSLRRPGCLGSEYVMIYATTPLFVAALSQN